MTRRVSYLYVSCVLLLAIGAGCVDRQQLSRADAIKHFHKNRSKFDRIATDWISGQPSDSIFIRPWAGDVRWNSTTMSLVPRNGQVMVMRDAVKQNMSFELAAKAAAVSPQVLRSWIDRLRDLDVSHVAVIGTELPESDRYLQIDLEEVGAHYGYIFVPAGHRAPFAPEDCSGRCSGFDFVRVLGAGWFYYESE